MSRPVMDGLGTYLPYSATGLSPLHHDGPGVGSDRHDRGVRIDGLHLKDSERKHSGNLKHRDLVLSFSGQISADSSTVI